MFANTGLSSNVILQHEGRGRVLHRQWDDEQHGLRHGGQRQVPETASLIWLTLLWELMEMILGEEPPALNSAVLTPEFTEMVFSLLHKDPGSRLDWAGLMAHPFWEVSGGGAGTAAGKAVAAGPLVLCTLSDGTKRGRRLN